MPYGQKNKVAALVVVCCSDGAEVGMGAAACVLHKCVVGGAGRVGVVW